MLYTKEQTQNIFQESFAYIKIKEENHSLTITLARPKKKNAMNTTMVREYAFAMSYAHHSPQIWAVVFEAEGDIWCAGADLKAMRGMEEKNNSSIPKTSENIVIGELFYKIHKPVIAKVHAPVYAGGFLILAGCTQVIATKNTKYGLPEAKRGIWPMQVVGSLLKIMPARKALDLSMRGATLSAEEAYDYGLVTTLVEEEELDGTVNKLLEEIFDSSPSAIRLGLKAYDEMRNVPEAELHPYLAQILAEIIKTKDAQEGLKAFAEKRKPIWRGE